MTIPWTSTTDDFDALWEDHTVPNIPDILATMFAQQEQHMRAYDELQHTLPIVDPAQYGMIDHPLVQAKIREHASYTVEELYEAINHLKNKPWKQSLRQVEREEFYEELADVWHFFIELHIIAGISPEDVFRNYFKKSLVNEQRRAENY